MACTNISWMLLSYLMLLSQIQANIQKEQPMSVISYDQDPIFDSSNTYALFMTPKSWTEANIACQKWNSGQLASVLSESEASYVANFVKDWLDNDNFAWIGLYDPMEGRYFYAWEWSNNDIMKYEAWEEKPPTAPHPGYCGSLIGKSGYRKWKDFNCKLALPYVCKFDNWRM